MTEATDEFNFYFHSWQSSPLLWKTKSYIRGTQSNLESYCHCIFLTKTCHLTETNKKEENVNDIL